MKSVDCRGAGAGDRSSPSRGTWIEILLLIRRGESQDVVPLTGDVD